MNKQIQQLAQQYSDRMVWIKVSEDSEYGAFVKYQTHLPHQSIKI